MPPLEVVAPIAVFVAMAALAAFVLWRTVALAGGLHEEAQLFKDLADIAGRAETALSELAPIVDEIRHRRAEGATAQPLLAIATTTVEACLTDARETVVSPVTRTTRDGLVGDLERAGRALDMIEHGCDLLDLPGREAKSEGETSVKRGYLNLLHAREALRAIRERAGRPESSPMRLSWWRRAR